MDFTQQGYMFDSIKRLFRKKRVEKSCLVPDVCINSPLYSSATTTSVSEYRNKHLLQYPIIYRAVDLICKSVSTYDYEYEGYSIILDTAKLYKVFFNSFISDTYVNIEVKGIDFEKKQIHVTVEPNANGTVKVENKQLSKIINKIVEVQLEQYYELLLAYYKASKVQGALLPANSENANSISFTLNEQVELSSRLERVFTDLKNAYNIISLTVPFEYVPFEHKFADTGLIELKELIKEDVGYIFGIPSLLLENNSNSTYNNLSESQRTLQENLYFYASIINDLLYNYIKKTNIIKK